MPNWHDQLREIRERGSVFDVVRREQLRRLHEKTGRNVILYYSAWLQKPGIHGLHVNDADKNGFMAVIHGLDRSKGLDLVLHTPGGEIAATESLVDYLRRMFGLDIRAVVPQLALSAGTMIACACRRILMGKHSSLGPVDPQLMGIPAHGVLEEFNRAHREIRLDPSRAAVWQPIISKYHPTLIGECEKAVKWANDMVRDWLTTGMFAGESAAPVATIVDELTDHALTLSHSRHLSSDRCREIGLKVDALESDQDLQEAVLSVHHSALHTLSATAAYKIVENHEGAAYIQSAPAVSWAGPRGQDSWLEP